MGFNQSILKSIIGKIDHVELFVLKIPLVNPFKTSYGIETFKEVLLIKLTSDGFSGWGECVSFKHNFYHEETIKISQFGTENFIIPLLLKNSDLSIKEILNLLIKIKGYDMAKAMVENALLDMHCRKKGIPLFAFLGGKKRKIMSGISLGITTDIEKLLENISDAVRKKYHRIKIKIKKGWDINVVSSIRERFPSIRLTVDANGDYSENDIDILKELDKFNLDMIEQPYGRDMFKEHSKLRKIVKTPICLDESITDMESVKLAVSLKSCKIVCIKQGRLGGILNAISVIEYCRKNKIDVWSGGMLETGIGRAVNIHLQTLKEFELPGDTSESSRFFDEDIVSEPVTLDSKGFIDIPDGSGTGIEVRAEMIEKFKIFNRTMTK